MVDFKSGIFVESKSGKNLLSHIPPQSNLQGLGHKGLLTHSWRICSFQLTLTFSKLQLNLPEALAKPGRGSVLVARDSPTHEQRGRCPRFAADPLVLTDALHASDLLPKMRIHFGTILLLLMRR